VLTSALAPVGIAYAVACGLPGACGLYATIVPLLAYALLGPSRILVLGPDSSLAAIILGIVAPIAAGDANRAMSRCLLKFSKRSLRIEIYAASAI
jgi:MFS superfamily sulfate permease-like transporter